MRARRGAATFLLLVALTESAWPQDAPFGFSWGPVDTVPKPMTAEREANVTTLFYDQDQAFARGTDTDRIIVEVCRTEGLQQIIWIGRRLPADELRRKFDAAHKRNVENYGDPKALTSLPNAESWRNGRVFLGMSKGLDGQQRLIMSLRGDLYEQCSLEHLAETGHGVGAHVLQLLLKVY